MIYPVLAIIVSSSIAFGAFGQTSGIFTDMRDTTDYKWIIIGSQTWMAENLNFTTAESSWCYDDNESNCIIYGRLYDWETAKEVCPYGWHLPSDEDWKEMERQLGIKKRHVELMGYRGHKKAGELKEAGLEHWGYPNSGATNETGFSALPAGYRFGNSYYYQMDYQAYFWTSTEWIVDDVGLGGFSRTLSFNLSGIKRFANNISFGLSVRCTKD